MNTIDTDDLLDWLRFEMDDIREQLTEEALTGTQYLHGCMQALEAVERYVRQSGRTTVDRLTDLFTREPDAHRLTQRELANRVGVSVTAVNKALRKVRDAG